MRRFPITVLMATVFLPAAMPAAAGEVFDWRSICASQQRKIPLVASDSKDFIGIWVGNWDRQMQAAVVVSAKTKDTEGRDILWGLYVVAGNEAWKVLPDCSPFISSIESGSLKINFNSGRNVVMELAPNGLAKYHRGQSVAMGSFSKE